ncbi:NADPH-dependent diflavin oxidoreductase 1 [Cryptococcus sp. DSM 104548]
MIPMILYASETGNAQDTAERVARAFRANNRAVSCLPMDAFPISSLPHTYLLILITSTHGRGDPPPAMLPLWKAMLRTSLPEDILEDVHFAVFGLGDSSYERFCYAGKMLLRRMEQLGANKMSEPAWGDERSPNGIENAFLPWLQETLDLFIPYLPPAKLNITSPLPTTELPPPIYALTKHNRPPTDDLDLGRLSISPTPNGTSAAPTRQEDKRKGNASISRVKPDDWVWATLKKNERVTSDDWWQDVREIELEFEDEDVNAYPPGSICSLQPQSRESDVDTFLELMDLKFQADDVFSIESLLPEQPLPAHLPPSGTPTTLRSLLTNHLDIQCSPRKSFFEWLRRFSPEELEKERLDEFIADPDEIHTYATRPSRTLVETLADFRHTRIPLSHLLEVLPPLRRRQFSIASSFEAHPNRVQLLIALVEYKTNLSLPRVGLCSSWLSSRLKPGTRVPIHIAAPTLFLPEDKRVPCIFVGPGTGVAPMRAFVEVRAKQGACENTALYFGCRSTKSDYYFSSEWDAYRQKGIKVEVATSRDQDEKVYVQHLIKRDKARVKEWIVDRKGWLFISGASNAMPREVREAVAWCISKDGAGNFTEEEAKEYVEQMFEDKRGGEESW